MNHLLNLDKLVRLSIAKKKKKKEQKKKESNQKDVVQDRTELKRQHENQSIV